MPVFLPVLVHLVEGVDEVLDQVQDAVGRPPPAAPDTTVAYAFCVGGAGRISGPTELLLVEGEEAGLGSGQLRW